MATRRYWLSQFSFSSKLPFSFMFCAYLLFGILLWEDSIWAPLWTCLRENSDEVNWRKMSICILFRSNVYTQKKKSDFASRSWETERGERMVIMASMSKLILDLDVFCAFLYRWVLDVMSESCHHRLNLESATVVCELLPFYEVKTVWLNDNEI